jgi:uncharacterized protein YggU (UPF0235/DUF167 family)
MAIQRMDHVGIVVHDLAAATGFFVELGLELQGEGVVEGRWVDRIVGLDGVRAEVAFLQTPDGHGRLELTRFHTPSGPGGDRHAQANAPARWPAIRRCERLAPRSTRSNTWAPIHRQCLRRLARRSPRGILVESPTGHEKRIAAKGMKAERDDPTIGQRIIRVRARAGARREAVVRSSADRYEISVRERAERGMANARIRELLAAALEVSPERLALISGAHRPAKTYRVLPRQMR